MHDLTVIEWGMAVLGAMCIGLSKGAFPGMASLAIGLYAHVFEPSESLGIILAILFLANIVAVIIFRRSADWMCIARLMPAAVLGIVVGYFFLLWIPTNHIGQFIGIMLLLMASIHAYRQYRSSDSSLNLDSEFSGKPIQYFSFAAFVIGFLSGFSSMVANAAGPITIIYLLSIRLEKFRFIATMAWLYLILNAFKIPFHVSLGNINAFSLKLSAILAVVAIATVLVSPFIVKHVPQRIFNCITWAFVVIASLKLIF